VNHFDAVIVGAGPAGLLVFEQLTAVGLTVALLEAGPKATSGQVPPSDPAIWEYHTEDGGALDWVRTHAVGGRTVGWGGFCFRFPQSVFRRGCWPYDADTLEPFYDAAERWVGIAEGLLLPSHQEAARCLGAQAVPLRGARRLGKVWTACDASGSESARTGHIACELTWKNGVATALDVRRPDHTDVRIHARAYVLAAGPIETARLLLASGVGQPAPTLGHGLTRHPYVNHLLIEPHAVPPRTNPDDLLDGALIPFPEEGYSLEVVGPTPLGEPLRTELQKHGLPVDSAGPLRVTYVNAMCETDADGRSQVAVPSRNRDSLGRPIPSIRLSATDRDKNRVNLMKENCVAMAEMIAAPGANFFILQDADLDRQLFHEAGTCAMGNDSGAVCNEWGRLCTLENVWIADASVFPSPGDRHPTLTVLAHAIRAAQDVCLSIGVRS
jgi:choline dehydrogenase-like flavoprotein